MVRPKIFAKGLDKILTMCFTNSVGSNCGAVRDDSFKI